jgi:hypothetical protein
VVQAGRALLVVQAGRALLVVQAGRALLVVQAGRALLGPLAVRAWWSGPGSSLRSEGEVDGRRGLVLCHAVGTLERARGKAGQLAEGRTRRTRRVAAAGSLVLCPRSHLQAASTTG